MSTELSVAKWLDFYRPYFADKTRLQTFVTSCAAQTGPTRAAKLIMHQVRRLVMLADEMETVRTARDSLTIFWYIVCAEAASKLQADYDKAKKSKIHVRRFFREFASSADKEVLARGFQRPEHAEPMTLIEAVDTLYAVRCDVAHEGNYWDFTLAQGLDMINVSPPAVVSLTSQTLRDILVRTGINAAQSRLPGCGAVAA